MTKRPTLLRGFLALAALPVLAPASLARVVVSYDYFPYARIANLPGNTGLEGARIAQTKISWDVTLPPLKWDEGRGMVVFVLHAENMGLRHKSFPASVQDDHFYGVDFSLNWVQNLNPAWKTVVTLKPGLYYDGHNPSRNIYLLQGRATLWKTLRPGLEAGLGAGVSNEFGDPELLPIVAVRYRADTGGERPQRGAYFIDVAAPIRASYFYVVGRGLHLGAQYQVSGNKYRITQGPLPDVSARLSVSTIGPALRLVPNKWSAIELSGGLAFARRYGIYRGDDQVTDYDLREAGFGRVSATITF